MKSKREIRFRSAREFCAQAALKISYPQYSRYEAGDQLPSLIQAISLCTILEVSSIETLLEWNQAQLSPQDTLTRSEVAKLLNEVRAKGCAGESSGLPEKAVTRLPLDEVIVFNRSHLKVFQSNPAYRDIFTYINSFEPAWIQDGEIAEVLGLELEHARRMLETLSELGVILKSDPGYRATKRIFYFPDDEDFFKLRNLNIEHNISSIMRSLKHGDLTARKACRGLVTRELTAGQAKRLIDAMEQLLQQTVALPETDKPETIFSLCVLFGERFTRTTAFSKPPNLE